MNIIEKLKVELKGNKKKIVLPETMDERVLKASEIIIQEDLVDLILLGDKEEKTKEYPILEKAEWINPKTSDLTQKYIEKLLEIRKEKGLTKEEAEKLLTEDNMYFSCIHVLPLLLLLKLFLGKLLLLHNCHMQTHYVLDLNQLLLLLRRY